jgi:hypothetical protein
VPKIKKNAGPQQGEMEGGEVAASGVEGFELQPELPPMIPAFAPHDRTASLIRADS